MTALSVYPLLDLDSAGCHTVEEAVTRITNGLVASVSTLEEVYAVAGSFGIEPQDVGARLEELVH